MYPIIRWIQSHDSTLVHFLVNNMAGFECNVSNKDFMEEVARYEYLYNCNSASQDFKDKNKNFKFWSL